MNIKSEHLSDIAHYSKHDHVNVYNVIYNYDDISPKEHLKIRICLNVLSPRIIMVRRCDEQRDGDMNESYLALRKATNTTHGPFNRRCLKYSSFHFLLAH